jgi:hypothetical protein
MQSKLTKNQKMKINRTFAIADLTPEQLKLVNQYRANIYSDEYTLKVVIRYDDECGNGHNTFSITSQDGCTHDLIASLCPDLAHLIKWHLCSSDGPMHYIANTLYHADEHGPDSAYVYEYPREVAGVKIREKCLVSTSLDKAQEMVDECPDLLYLVVKEDTAKVANLEYARSSAIAPNATIEQLRDKQWLMDRLPALLEEFRADIETLGFVW